MGREGFALLLPILLLNVPGQVEAVTDTYDYNGTIFSNSYGCDQLMALPYEAQAFESPGNYPIFYPNDADVCWVIEAYDTTYKIYIEPLTSNTESLVYVSCEWADYVEVRNGGTPTSNLLATWCGAGVPGNTFNTSNKAFIRFRSDGRVNAGGFQIKYWSYIPNVWLEVDDPYAPEPEEEEVEIEEIIIDDDNITVTEEPFTPAVGASTSGGGLSAGLVTAIVVAVIAFIVIITISTWQIYIAYQRTKKHYQRKAYNAHPDAYGRPRTSRHRSKSRASRPEAELSEQGSIRSRDRPPRRRSSAKRSKPSRPRSAENITGMTKRGTILVSSNVPNVETAGTKNEKKRARLRKKSATSSRRSGGNSASSSMVSFRPEGESELVYESEMPHAGMASPTLPDMEEEHDNPAFLKDESADIEQEAAPEKHHVITVASNEVEDVPESVLVHPPPGRLPPLKTPGNYGSMGSLPPQTKSIFVTSPKNASAWLERGVEEDTTNEDGGFPSRPQGLPLAEIHRPPDYSPPPPYRNSNKKQTFDYTLEELE